MFHIPGDFKSTCKRDLGMQTKEIRSDQITSKSHYTDSVQANYGRYYHRIYILSILKLPRKYTSFKCLIVVERE